MKPGWFFIFIPLLGVMVGALVVGVVVVVLAVQGWTLWCAPGSVNLSRKYCVLLPAAGRRTQLFHLIFTEPGVPVLGHPCILVWTPSP